MTTSQQTEAQQTQPDLRPLLLHAVEVADRLVAEVGPDDLHRPTPCEEYDVRDLVDHLVMVARRIRIVLAGRHFAEAEPSGAASVPELRAAWTEAVAELRSAAPGFDLAAPVTAPFGTVPGGAAVASYVGEVAVHAWDLAVALDRTDLLDLSLGEPLLAPAQERIPREGREFFPFGPVVDVADDASAHDRLVAWMGRDPHWRAGSTSVR